MSQKYMKLLSTVICTLVLLTLFGNSVSAFYVGQSSGDGWGLQFNAEKNEWYFNYSTSSFGNPTSFTKDKTSDDGWLLKQKDDKNEWYWTTAPTPTPSPIPMTSSGNFYVGKTSGDGYYLQYNQSKNQWYWSTTRDQ